MVGVPTPVEGDDALLDSAIDLVIVVYYTVGGEIL